MESTLDTSMDTTTTAPKDDDDVVILDDDHNGAPSRTPPGGSIDDTAAETGSSAQIDKLAKHLNRATAVASQVSLNAALIRNELDRMESDISKAVCKSIKFILETPRCVIKVATSRSQLDEMIQATLLQMQEEKLLDVSRSEFLEYSFRFREIEKKNQAVSKMFLDIHSSIQKVKKEMQAEAEALDKECAASTEPCMLIDSDDGDHDDDVTIVGSAKGESSQSTAPPAMSSLPPMEQLRSQFAKVVNQSMPNLMSSLSNNTAAAAASMPKPPAGVNAAPVKWPEIKVGDEVIGMKPDNSWSPGSVCGILPEKNNEQWSCRVRFSSKLARWLKGREVAYAEPINCFLRVGTRVIALYREEDSPNTLFPGIVAEAPSNKNQKRFLVFFDDGYAQYCQPNELHKIYRQSTNVWEDIHPDSREFIKEYLRIYPERPMVRLSPGQVMRTEWNGKWWTAKVQQADASLVKMYFAADSRTEWIYRGSLRLEPLYKALANAIAIKQAGTSRGRRHNLTMRPSDGRKRPQVEYTRGTEDEPGPTTASKGMRTSRWAHEPSNKKKVNTARKSTGGMVLGGSGDGSGTRWEPPWVKYQRKASSSGAHSTSDGPPAGPVLSASGRAPGPSARPGRGSDIASILAARLANSEMEYDEQMATGERKAKTIEIKKQKKEFKPHSCGPLCVAETDEEPDKFRGQNILLIPLLCAWERQVCKARPTSKRFVIYRAPCGRRLRTMEEVDGYLAITDSKLHIDFFSFDYHLHVNTEFVPVKTFCDIKDMSYGKENYPISCVNGVDRLYPDYVEYENHRIPSTGVHLNLDPDFLMCCDCTDQCRDKSKCACQQQTVENTTCIGEKDPSAGYKHKHLPEPLFTGLVECNSRCKCDKRCRNRVAQQGLRRRLQVFKTEKKGWGLRCLDDIAKGSFICIYAGQLLTDKGANEDGKQFGDEYLAELDFIEVVESQKEGYESDVESISDHNSKGSHQCSGSDSDYDEDWQPTNGEIRRSKRHKPRKTGDTRKTEEDTKKTEDDTTKTKEETKKSEDDTKMTEGDTRKEEGKPDLKEGSEPKASTESGQPSSSSQVHTEGTPSDTDVEMKDADKMDSDSSSKVGDKAAPTPGLDTKTDEGSPPLPSPRDTSRPRAKKSTGGSRFNLSTSIKTCQEAIAEKGEAKLKKVHIPTRTLFKDDTECYIMDAKSMGNLGRFLNHSCAPNVFVQNIFVDTHDLRFPWVAFFAGQYIPAGTELTWDYNYEVGSVSDKVMYCYCGAPTCRGRLL